MKDAEKPELISGLYQVFIKTPTVMKNAEIYKIITFKILNVTELGST